MEYCIENDSFTKEMISLGIKTEMHENSNIQMRQVAYAINEILTSDIDEIANLFIID